VVETAARVASGVCRRLSLLSVPPFRCRRSPQPLATLPVTAVNTTTVDVPGPGFSVPACGKLEQTADDRGTEARTDCRRQRNDINEHAAGFRRVFFRTPIQRAGGGFFW
jgi:hypothetical protein